MSHFSVIVVTDDSLESSLQAALQPFHEFECTGTDDQYVQDVDVTAEAREAYEKAVRRVFVSPDGTRFEKHAEQFYRAPTPEEREKIGPVGGTGTAGGLSFMSKDWGDGLGYRTRVHFKPEGWTESEVPTSEIEKFAEYVEGYYGLPIVTSKREIDVYGEHKYGHMLVDENGEVVVAINRTNPNKKWDWWEIGGRFSGALATADGPCDKARFGDLDFDKMLNRQLQRVQENWNEAEGKTAQIRSFLYGIEPEDTLEKLLERVQPLRSFSILLNGEWIASGSMGWFGVVRDEKGQDDWNKSVAQIVAKIKADQFLWVVDCHI